MLIDLGVLPKEDPARESAAESATIALDTPTYGAMTRTARISSSSTAAAAIKTTIAATTGRTWP
jgi:hypothetical protein